MTEVTGVRTSLYQNYDIPVIPKNIIPKPNDIWFSYWSNYHIDKVEYLKDNLIIYATKTCLSNVNKNPCYKVDKTKKGN